MIKNIPISAVKLAMSELGIISLSDRSVQRLSTCYNCNEGKALCPACGCIVKMKVIEDSETCPKNKWQ